MYDYSCRKQGCFSAAACSMPWHFPVSLPECKPRFRHKRGSGSLPLLPFFLSGTPETAPLPHPANRVAVRLLLTSYMSFPFRNNTPHRAEPILTTRIL